MTTIAQTRLFEHVIQPRTLDVTFGLTLRLQDLTLAINESRCLSYTIRPRCWLRLMRSVWRRDGNA